MLSSFSKNLLLSLALVALAANNTFAADLEHGLDIAKRVCGACHGSKGISRAPVIPNLSTQKEEYILKQLRSFKDGSRSNSSMEGVVVNLDDKDLVDVAAHFAANGTIEDTSAKVAKKTQEKAKDKLNICLPCHSLPPVSSKVAPAATAMPVWSMRYSAAPNASGRISSAN